MALERCGGFSNCFFGSGAPSSSEYAKQADAEREKAEAGDAQAQYELGIYYQYGLGVPRDLAQSAKWYAKSANQGLPDAQISLGAMHEYGRGVPQDDVTADMWYFIAANSNADGAAASRARPEKKITARKKAEARKRTTEWKPGKSPF